MEEEKIKRTSNQSLNSNGVADTLQLPKRRGPPARKKASNNLQEEIGQ